ncbi:MAG: FAD-dependent oxidoreductase [Novosphingobium sp.]|nr:FAD-dependent oxidoreductase [Novosphingobium sp.]
MDDDLPVAVVGAGFSGTLLAINLLRLRQRVVLIERDAAKLAKGQAFGTRRPEHLLNVRAANMSAYPDDLGHFGRWMGFTAADQVNRFVPRLAYGQYLLEQLIDALAAGNGRGEVRAGEVVGAEFDHESRQGPGKRSITLRFADGTYLECRAVVLALGNFAPRPVAALADLPAGLVLPDPWSPIALQGLTAAEHVLLIGTGLTAVDVALSLDHAGFNGQITALSRRGLRPHAHTDAVAAVPSLSRPQIKGSQLLRAIRRRADAIGWREAIDELRPHVQDLWRAHSVQEQARFLRHARPYWDIHRHRLAPAVDRRIAELEATGRLRFIGGKLLDAAPVGASASIDFRPRGTADIQRLKVDRVINCTGPDGNLRLVRNELIGELLRAGRIKPDAHNLGIDVDHAGRVRDATGVPQDAIFAVGPITKGEAWEIVAVPDIRRQVWNVARLLADEHWVGGEGL